MSNRVCSVFMKLTVLSVFVVAAGAAGCGGGGGGTAGAGGETGTTVLQGVFVPTGSMAVARERHTATLLGNGKVLIAGGFHDRSGSPEQLASAELYDPAAGIFVATGSMTVARLSPTATLLGNGKVLIAGGDYFDFSTSTDTIFASADLYDPATGTFTPTGSMTVARSGHTATLLGNGMVLIAGGWAGTGTAAPASVELYDPSTGTFTPTASMTVARMDYTATSLANGKALIAGGTDGYGYLASAELYAPAAGTFTPTGSMTVIRDGYTATLLRNGKVLVAGGWDVTPGPTSAPVLATAELYDPTAGSFTATGDMTGAGPRGSATLLANGNVLLVGVVSGDRAELYDPAAGTFTPTGSMTLERFEYTATLLPNGKVLVAGGATANQVFLASAELYQ